MSRHILKIDPKWFDRLADDTKTAEIRKHDRDFQIYDEVVFVEDAWESNFTRPRSVRAIEATISHILPASVFPEGLRPGYSMLSLRDLSAVYHVAEGEQP